MVVEPLNLSVGPLLAAREDFLLKRSCRYFANFIIIGSFIVSLLINSLNSNSVVNKLCANSPCYFLNKLLSFIFDNNVLVSIANVLSLNHLSVCTSNQLCCVVLISTLFHLDVRLHL
jgi:hypothetical protein